MEHPFVSVIIPVYDDLIRLVWCLQALAQQTYPADRFEIIVVDNETTPVVTFEALPSLPLRLVHESRPSSYAARNRGIAVARGEILAFTDSDCQPHQHWIACGVARLKEMRECGLVGGHIDVVARGPGEPNWIERYELLTAFPQQSYVEAEHFAVTANLFTCRHVVEIVGTFDARLKSSGDAEWGQRAFERGFQLVYEPRAQVQHPARATLASLWQKAARKAGGFYDRTKGQRPWQRQLIGALWGLTPPLSTIRQLAGDGRVSGLVQRSQIAFLVLFVHYAGAMERVRLTLGGESRRR